MRIMRKYLCLFILMGGLGFSFLQSNAQSIDMQFVESPNTDCANNTACFLIQIRSTDGGDYIGNASIRFTYNSSAILFDGFYSGGSPDLAYLNTGAYTDINFTNDAACTGVNYLEHSYDGRFAGDFLLTLVLLGNTNFLTPCINISDGAWYDVSEICFDLLDPNADPMLEFIGVENGAPSDGSPNQTNFNDGTNDVSNKYSNGSFGHFTSPVLLSCACPVNLLIDEMTVLQASHQAANLIETNGSVIVGMGDNVEFRSNELDVHPGFEVDLGGEFAFYNDPCSVPISLSQSRLNTNNQNSNDEDKAK